MGVGVGVAGWGWGGDGGEARQGLYFEIAPAHVAERRQRDLVPIFFELAVLIRPLEMPHPVPSIVYGSERLRIRGHLIPLKRALAHPRRVLD